MSEEDRSTVRIPISKRQRFEIFKRDDFICQYCGRRPPDVVLEIDHLIPTSARGGNELHNLLTACFDCNRGKSNKSLDAPPFDVDERRRLIEERREQVHAYEELLRREREELEDKIDEVISVYDYYFSERPKCASRHSIRNFLRHLVLPEVQEAMSIACERMDNPNDAFLYFCGVCWRKIKGPQK